MPVSPSTDNYYVGKGKISFKATGAPTFRDLGNVTELETTPNLTTLEHFSSREGVKKKDKEVVTEKKLTVAWSWTNGPLTISRWRCLATPRRRRRQYGRRYLFAQLLRRRIEV